MSIYFAWHGDANGNGNWNLHGLGLGFVLPSTDLQISDFQKMDAISRQGKTIAVIGGSFLGTEITYSLSRRGE